MGSLGCSYPSGCFRNDTDSCWPASVNLKQDFKFISRTYEPEAALIQKAGLFSKLIFPLTTSPLLSVPDAQIHKSWRLEDSLHSSLDSMPLSLGLHKQANSAPALLFDHSLHAKSGNTDLQTSDSMMTAIEKSLFSIASVKRPRTSQVWTAGKPLEMQMQATRTRIRTGTYAESLTRNICPLAESGPFETCSLEPKAGNKRFCPKTAAQALLMSNIQETGNSSNSTSRLERIAIERLVTSSS